MAEGLCEAIAIAGGAGKWPAHPAGGDNYGIGFIMVIARLHRKSAAILFFQRLDTSPVDEDYPCPSCGIEQNPADIRCPVGNRKDAAILFKLGGQPLLGEKLPHGIRRKLVQAVFEKSPAEIVFADKILNRSGMRQIAAAPPGLEEFAADAGVFLDDDGFGPRLRSKHRSHQARRPTTNNAHIIFHTGIVSGKSAIGN